MLRRAEIIPRHSPLTQTLSSADDGVYAETLRIAITPASRTWPPMRNGSGTLKRTSLSEAEAWGPKANAASTIPANNNPWFFDALRLFMWTPFSVSRREEQ